MSFPDLASFRSLARQGNVIVLSRQLMSDQLTPVLGYRRLVAPDERTAPSFLFESVENGANVGRFSFIGAQPSVEVVARRNDVTIVDHQSRSTRSFHDPDPLSVPRRLTADWKLAVSAEGTGPRRFAGGWVGYAGYDTVRYLEAEKLPFSGAPADDRGLPDLHFGQYRQIGVFDHVAKTLQAIHHVVLDEHESIEKAYTAGCAGLEEFVIRLESHSVPLPAGRVDLDLNRNPHRPMTGTYIAGGFEHAVGRCLEFIGAGDAFQVVLSQRFERQTTADPFEIYRSLRIVNPSPYMIYLQAQDCILVASSPEILCRCVDGTVTSRPLAGTRRRGRDGAEDHALESELLNDPKEHAEHVMLVDLGRNDLGRICRTGSIALERIMEVERYSHVMHLSSTLTGRLRTGLDCWDALRHTLPVGTVSGAPKVRAMQIIDSLEPTRRGPYAGGIGAIGFNGDMDVALALRTMVIPTNRHAHKDPPSGFRPWTVHLQAGAGIVADSHPQSEREETINKAAALGRAIDLAESAFGPAAASTGTGPMPR